MTTFFYNNANYNRFINQSLGLMLILSGLLETGCHFSDRQFQVQDHLSQIGQHTANAGNVQTVDADINDAAVVQLRISGRVDDAKVFNSINRMNTTQAINMFSEASSMIDARHLNPTNDEVRTQTGLTQLALALDNQSFRQRAGVRVQGSSLALIKQQLLQVANNVKVKNRRDSQQMIQYAADYLQRSTGMNPTWAIYEYTNAIVESQDKYSALMVGNQFTNQSVELKPSVEFRTASEAVVGIGVELKAEPNGARVVRPLQGGPAEQAGVTRGDMIVSVNGASMQGLDLEQMASVIRGPMGTQLTLQVKRLDNSLQTIVVRRNQIEQKSVSEVRMLTGAEKVGYIKIDKFAADSARLVEQGLWTLHNQGMKSVIIDVRGNPGGLLTSAIEISDIFLANGTIVSTRGRDMRDNMQETAKFSQTWKVPLTVLVDSNSASASEIFAAAIQDNKRGVIVGTTSYGKGTVQTHFPMSSISGTMKLTTAKFYAPSGREMAGSGVNPDIAVQVDTNNALTWSNDDILTRALSINAQTTSLQLASYNK